MLLQQFLGTLVLFGHETLDFSVDHLTSLWTDLAIVLDRSPKVLELLTCVAHRAELFTHAEFGDHTASQLSCPHYVVTGPGADSCELHHFGGTPSQHHGDPVLQFVDREQIAVLGWHLHRVAQGATAVWNNADLADRFTMRHQFSHQRVAGLVKCNRGSLLLVHHSALFLRTRNHPFDGSLEIIQRNCRGLVPGSEQGRFIHGIRQISAAEASCHPGGPLQVKVCRQLYVLTMNLQDLHSSNEIWIANGDLAVKAARAQKCWVEHLRTVGSSHDDHWGAGVGFETVNLGQQLVESLLTLVVAAQAHCTSPALADGINLVNENDRRSCLPRLLEQVSHACCADPHKHLNEFGATGLEERDLGLAGRSFGQQRLAGTRGPDDQYALGDTPAELSELLWRLQKLNDFLELRNGFIRPTHIFVCDRNVLGLDLDRFALPDPKDAAHPSAGGPARSLVGHVPETA